ncbi:MAG: PCRF domain-containing protein [Candidatus Paceibacterota bacterium]
MEQDSAQKLDELKNQIRQLADKLDIENKRSRAKELEFEFSDADFWKDKEKADLKIKEIGELNDLIKKFDEIEKELAATGAENSIGEITAKIRRLETETMFSGKYDKGSAVISIYAGAGGEDAGDWAKMLFNMYLKFSEKRGWQTKIIDDNVLEVKGNYAYGYLKKESGVHRLVRISPFSAEKKRHTSFVLVEVLPEFKEPEDKESFKIPDDDLRIEFSRSSGPGGQNVNKVETAVRIVHLPTNLSAASQSERSQSQNREKAMNLLKAKLLKLMEENEIKEINNLKVKVKPEWGSQIRSYVLNPYKLVKDHRNGVETAQVENVLAGDLDLFVESDILNKSL